MPDEDTQLPFGIYARLADERSAIVVAFVDAGDVTNERYQLGNGKRRREIAAAWSKDPRLTQCQDVPVDAIIAELEKLELEGLKKIQAAHEAEAGRIQRASYVDAHVIAELAWNEQIGRADFITYFRADQNIDRTEQLKTEFGTIVPPVMCPGIVTPDSARPGAVFLPTVADPVGLNEDGLREDITAFIARYVELPAGASELAVTYVFLSWIYDAFDELPYLGFRTS